MPVGTAATIQKHLETADSLFVHFDFYTVRRGETHRHDRAEISRLASRAAPGQRPHHQDEGEGRPGPDDSAASGARRLPAAAPRRPASVAMAAPGAHDPLDLPRAARRHALQHRPPIRHDGGRRSSSSTGCSRTASASATVSPFGADPLTPVLGVGPFHSAAGYVLPGHE